MIIYICSCLCHSCLSQNGCEYSTVCDSWTWFHKHSPSEPQALVSHNGYECRTVCNSWAWFHKRIWTTSTCFSHGGCECSAVCNSPAWFQKHSASEPQVLYVTGHALYLMFIYINCDLCFTHWDPMKVVSVWTRPSNTVGSSTSRPCGCCSAFSVPASLLLTMRFFLLFPFP